jgi:hypothetical protein
MNENEWMNEWMGRTEQMSVLAWHDSLHWERLWDF